MRLQKRWLFDFQAIGAALLAMNAGASAAEPGASTSPVATRYYDLTGGDARELPAPVRVPGEQTTPIIKYIDLTSDAPPVRDKEEPATVLLPIVVTPPSDPGDPYEAANRNRFESHVALHRRIIDPVENVYVGTVPQPVRIGLRNFLTNLESPSVFANNVLQGRIVGAGATLTRFVINSTVGIAGIFDIAVHAGLPYRDDDFGRTLAAYGVSDRPYLLVPIIGPSNPRDLTGKVVDVFFNPLHYIALPGGIVTSAGHAGAHELDKRSVDVGELDALTRTAPDPYAAERTKARERRNRETGTYAVPQ